MVRRISLAGIYTKYTHHDIQNDITYINGFELVTRETRDTGKKEQMSIVLRYEIACSVSPFFVSRCADLDARSLSVKTIETVEGTGIDT